jgi:hypothetical protein
MEANADQDDADRSDQHGREEKYRQDAAAKITTIGSAPAGG